MAINSNASKNIYGQTHIDETPQLIAQSAEDLKVAIAKIPKNEKNGWLQAMDRCPELVGGDHRLMFLRCEVFNAERAAKRLVKYWDMRIKIFGEQRAFRRITLGLDGALETSEDRKMRTRNDDDSVPSRVDSEVSSAANDEEDSLGDSTYKALSLGTLRPTITHDTGGRAILFVDPSRAKDYDTTSNEEARRGAVCALWYILHAMLDDEATQKLGIVVVVYPRDMKGSTFDPRLLKMNLASLNGCVPVRVGGIHVCHPPWFFGKIVYPILRLAMSARTRKRVHAHVGSEEKVLCDLESFGLPKEASPMELGGEVDRDHNAWLLERKMSGL